MPYLQVLPSSWWLGPPAVDGKETWAVEFKVVGQENEGQSLVAIDFASKQSLEASPIGSAPRASDYVGLVTALAAKLGTEPRSGFAGVVIVDANSVTSDPSFLAACQHFGIAQVFRGRSATASSMERALRSPTAEGMTM